jgi:hypothetical protein
MQTNFSVQIGKFAERHYIKNFEKKYKGHWDVTLRAIVAELERIDLLISNTDKAETIKDAGEIKIVKTKFRVAGTKESAKSSGNRCIVLWDVEKKNVVLLLVYCKTDLSGRNETAEWTGLVKDGYPEYTKFL